MLNKFLFKGALLGAGASVIGLGSDLLGSIRIPAFLNGVFGHKPTAGKSVLIRLYSSLL